MGNSPEMESMSMKKRFRYRKLIQPKLQLRLVSSFLVLSAIALIFQMLLFARAASQIANQAPEDVPSILLQVLLLSLGVVLPLTLLVGVVVTNKIAGPIYRFSVFLNEVREGSRPRDCKLRAGDYLHDFCGLLNAVTAPLREGESATEKSHELEPRAGEHTGEHTGEHKEVA